MSSTTVAVLEVTYFTRPTSPWPLITVMSVVSPSRDPASISTV